MTKDTAMGWDRMSEREILVHIAGKIDALIEKDERHQETLQDHEGRIRKNEQWRWRTAALGGGGATILVGLIIAILKAGGWLG